MRKKPADLTKKKRDLKLKHLKTATERPAPNRELPDPSMSKPIGHFTLQNPLLVVVGMPGSGKSTIVDHLDTEGWSVVHFGAITLSELKKRGLAINEANERKVREELREIHGMEAYAKLSIDQIGEALAKGPTVIDGLYSWSEYKFLRNTFANRFQVIAVFTPRKLRYERLAQRSIRPLSYKEAEARDFAEIENIEKGGPIAMADFTLDNGGTMENIYVIIDKLLDSL